jgi:hypothetical protein
MNIILLDINWFSLYVTQKIKNAEASFGIGGYAEDRVLYKRLAQFGGANARSIHLGVDIWGPSGTKFMHLSGVWCTVLHTMQQQVIMVLL